MRNNNLTKRIKSEASSFKSFAFKDDIITLAIGVVIGTAFKSLIDSLVENIFTPPIGFLTSKLDFNNLFITLGTNETYKTIADAKAAGAVVIQYGAFINTLISFLITAIVVYIFIYKTNQSLHKAVKKEEKQVQKTTRECPYCLSEISNKAIKCPYCTSNIKPTFQEK